MLRKLNLNIAPLLLVVILLFGVCGKVVYFHKESRTKDFVTSQTKEESKQKTQLDAKHWSVEAVVPLLNLDIEHYYYILFFISPVSQANILFDFLSFRNFREKYLEILFTNIISPNAP